MKLLIVWHNHFFKLHILFSNIDLIKKEYILESLIFFLFFFLCKKTQDKIIDQVTYCLITIIFHILFSNINLKKKSILLESLIFFLLFLLTTQDKIIKRSYLLLDTIIFHILLKKKRIHAYFSNRWFSFFFSSFLFSSSTQFGAR